MSLETTQVGDIWRQFPRVAQRELTKTQRTNKDHIREGDFNSREAGGIAMNTSDEEEVTILYRMATSLVTLVQQTSCRH